MFVSRAAPRPAEVDFTGNELQLHLLPAEWTEIEDARNPLCKSRLGAVRDFQGHDLTTILGVSRRNPIVISVMLSEGWIALQLHDPADDASLYALAGRLDSMVTGYRSAVADPEPGNHYLEVHWVTLTQYVLHQGRPVVSESPRVDRWTGMSEASHGFSPQPSSRFGRRLVVGAEPFEPTRAWPQPSAAQGGERVASCAWGTDARRDGRLLEGSMTPAYGKADGSQAVSDHACTLFEDEGVGCWNIAARGVNLEKYNTHKFTGMPTDGGAEPEAAFCRRMQNVAEQVGSLFAAEPGFRALFVSELPELLTRTGVRDPVGSRAQSILTSTLEAFGLVLQRHGGCGMVTRRENAGKQRVLASLAADDAPLFDDTGLQRLADQMGLSPRVSDRGPHPVGMTLGLYDRMVAYELGGELFICCHLRFALRSEQIVQGMSAIHEQLRAKVRTVHVIGDFNHTPRQLVDAGLDPALLHYGPGHSHCTDNEGTVQAEPVDLMVSFRAPGHPPKQ